MLHKRLFDLISTLLILPVLLPFACLSYPVLAWLLGQPVLFRQKRMGRNGQVFVMYKVRSMHRNAESTKNKHANLNEAPWPMFKIGDDPRFITKKITLPLSDRVHKFKVGQFLSRSGLDELPQLWNVLRGEMSLVGPRPLPVEEAEALRQQDPAWYKWRHSVRPGIFSLWALDSQHNKSLTHWKKLEKRGLSLTLFEQIKLIGKITHHQLQSLVKIVI